MYKKRIMIQPTIKPLRYDIIVATVTSLVMDYTLRIDCRLSIRFHFKIRFCFKSYQFD